MAEAFDTGSPYSASPRGRSSDLSSSVNPASSSTAEQGVFSPQFHFDEPTVEAIYPNFFIITWNPPHLLSSSATASASSSPNGAHSDPHSSAPSSRQSSLAPGSTQPQQQQSGPPRATWNYIVEWQGVLGIDVHRTTELSSLHAVIPIEFSHESIIVRVVAKGTVLITLDATSRIFVTAKITVNTRKLSPMPWLDDGAAASPVIDGALALASSVSLLQSPDTLIDAPLRLPLWQAQFEQPSETPVLIARGTILQQSEYAAVKVEHSTSIHPLPTKAVLYVVCHGVMYSDAVIAQSTASVIARSNSSNLSNSRSSPAKRPPSLMPTAVLQNALQDGCSIVFTGLGERGTIASNACHRFLASLLNRNEAGNQSHVSSLCRRVFCVTFNSPREEFYQADSNLILNGSAAYSGQFLHLFLSSALPARNSGFLESVSKVIKPKKCSNALLGMRCGFSIDLSNRNWYLRVIASTSTDVRVDDLALCTMKDESVLTKLLTATRRKISFGDAVQCYTPQVVEHDVKFGVGMEVLIQLRGLSLAPEAHVTARTGSLRATPFNDEVAPVDHDPQASAVAACTVRRCSYTSIDAVVDFVTLIPRAVWKQPPTAALDAMTGLQSSSYWYMSFSLTISTTAGWVTVPQVQLRVPISLLEVIWPRLRSQRAATWMYGKPNHLFAAAISVEPLNASLYNGHGLVFVPHTTTKVLSSLEFSSEIAAANPLIPKKKSTSILSIFAAKVQSVTNDSSQSNGGAAASSSGLPQMLTSIAQPPAPPRASSGVFADGLSEHIEKRRTASFFPNVMAPWRSKIVTALPWLDDNAYAAKLKLLYCALVRRIPPSRLEPWVTPTETAMEASLSTAVLQYLQPRIPNVNWDEPLFHFKSFEQFYKDMFPLVQSASSILCSEGAMNSSGGGSLAGSPTSNSNSAPKELPSSTMMAFHDVMALWVISLVNHLRRLHIFSKTILLHGPSGCGATVMLNELKIIRNYFDSSVFVQSPVSSAPAAASSLQETEVALASVRGALAGKQTNFVVRRMVRLEDVLAIIPTGIDLLILGVVDVKSFHTAEYQQLQRSIEKVLVANTNRTVMPTSTALSSTRSTMQDTTSPLKEQELLLMAAAPPVAAVARQSMRCVVTKLDECLTDFSLSPSAAVTDKEIAREATKYVLAHHVQMSNGKVVPPSSDPSMEVTTIAVSLQASISTLEACTFVKHRAKHSSLTTGEVAAKTKGALNAVGLEEILSQLVAVACI